jgi:hypothetical protein
MYGSCHKLRTSAVDLNGAATQPPVLTRSCVSVNVMATLYQLNQEVIAESTYKSVMKTFFSSLTLTNDMYTE